MINEDSVRAFQELTSGVSVGTHLFGEGRHGRSPTPIYVFPSGTQPGSQVDIRDKNHHMLLVAAGGKEPLKYARAFCPQPGVLSRETILPQSKLLGFYLV